MQVSLVLAVIATSLAGVLSNPLFTLANNSVSHTPLLKAAIENNAASVAMSKSATTSEPALVDM
jgi:NAD(P)H-quinone oxidoreductase subunit 2